MLVVITNSQNFGVFRGTRDSLTEQPRLSQAKRSIRSVEIENQIPVPVCGHEEKDMGPAWIYPMICSRSCHWRDSLTGIGDSVAL